MKASINSMNGIDIKCSCSSVLRIAPRELVTPKSTWWCNVCKAVHVGADVLAVLAVNDMASQK